MPYQVALEFCKDRYDVIDEVNRRFESIEVEVDNLVDSWRKKITPWWKWPRYWGIVKMIGIMKNGMIFQLLLLVHILWLNFLKEVLDEKKENEII